MDSAINQVHPDGEPDDADLFFGGDDDETEVETPQAEEAAEAELSDPDPGTFNPESGKFDEPDPTPASPTTSDEPPTPDTDGETDGPTTTTPAESDGPTDPDPDGPNMDPTPGVLDADSPPTESIPTPSDAPVSTEESSEGTSQSEPTQSSQAEPATESPATTDGSSDGSSESGKTSGALEREYRVFHKLQLTEKALKFLLAEIEEGRAPEPRTVYLQVHKTMARNVNGAITEAYTKHKKTVGTETDLAAVSSRAFQERHVAPKQRPETYLSIS